MPSPSEPRTPAIDLPGLPGTNPLGFLAALGALRAATTVNPHTALAWNDHPVPTPTLHGIATIPDLIEAVLADRDDWLNAVVLDFDGIDDIKLEPDQLRRYLTACRADGPRSADLAAALVTQHVVDGNGAAKPTDLHFTAGQQKFLAMASDIRDGLQPDHLATALEGPWAYTSKLPSLMWDTADDRLYALSAIDPGKDKKLTEPGAEWLALLGLTTLPVSIGQNRTLTPGCAGRWKNGTFTWPLWATPATLDTTRSLLATTTPDTPPAVLHARGITTLLQSAIRRADQGGYGTIGPPRTIHHSGTAPVP